MPATKARAGTSNRAPPMPTMPERKPAESPMKTRSTTWPRSGGGIAYGQRSRVPEALRPVSPVRAPRGCGRRRGPARLVQHLHQLGDHLVAAERGHQINALDVLLGLGQELLGLQDALG